MAEPQEFPVVTCPHCGREFQWDDYYDVSEGSTTECPRCEKEIFVLAIEQVVRGWLGKTADEKPWGAA